MGKESDVEGVSGEGVSGGGVKASHSKNGHKTKLFTQLSILHIEDLYGVVRFM